MEIAVANAWQNEIFRKLLESDNRSCHIIVGRLDSRAVFRAAWLHAACGGWHDDLMQEARASLRDRMQNCVNAERSVKPTGLHPLRVPPGYFDT